MKTIKILLSKIDFDDNSYNFSPEAADTLPPDLEQSLTKFGILHPPILQEKPTGLYAIISGQKRILFARDRCKSASCLCLVIPQKMAILSAWEIALEERIQKGPLTPIEKAIFFQKVLETCTIEEAAALFLPPMGQPAQTFSIKQMLPLAQLEEPIQQALQEGTLDHKAARMLCDLSFRNRLALFDIISNLRLSVGYQKKCINICKELEMRSGEAILTILSKPAFQEIIDSDANLPQKATNLMKYLSDLASPRLAEAKKEFNRFINTVELPRGALLTPSPSFETNELTLTLKFKDQETFLKYWDGNKGLYSKK